MKSGFLRQRGLSLIEIMVALTLSLILTLGLVHIFTANSQSFRLAEASARIQESGRMAMGILSREVRNSDYWGCLRDPSVLNSILNPVGDVDRLLRGLDAENGTGPDGSDRLILGGAGGTSNAQVQFVPTLGAATMQVNDVSQISQGDILIITNCQAGDILQVSNDPSANNSVQVNHNTGNSQGPPGNETSDLSFDYPKDPNGGQIFTPKQQRFYLRDNNGRRELVTDGVNVRTGGTTNAGAFSTPVALLEDVRNFQVQLGIDINGDGRVNNWNDPGGLDAAGESLADRAVAVRMSFLIRSPQNNVTSGGQSYCFPGWLDCDATPADLTTVADDDRFLYRVYSSTVTLRNRVN